MPNEWDDEDLLRTPEEAGPAPQRRHAGPWFFAAFFLAAAAVAAYVAFGNWTIGPRPTTAVPSVPAAATGAAQPLGGDPLSVTVPPLDQSDALVGELLRKLSTHPRVTAWLASKGLVRNFTAVVANIAEGMTPTALLPVLRPSSRFNVIERGTASISTLRATSVHRPCRRRGVNRSCCERPTLCHAQAAHRGSVRRPRK
jgi:hypothetical protein